MKALQRHKEIIFQVGILGMALTLPLDIKYGNISVIAAFAFSLFYIKRKHFSGFRLFVVSYPFIFFLISLTSSFFSKDMVAGFSRLDRHLVPLLLTMVFLVFNKVSLNRVLVIFSFFLSITTLILTIKVLYGFFTEAKLEQLIFHEYTSLFGQHPVYYALMILIALLFLVTKIRTQSFWQKPDFLWWLQVVILGSGLILCASKAVLAIFFLLLFLGSFIYWKEIRSKLLVFSLLGILIWVIYNVEYINDRFLDGISVKKEIMEFRPSNDFTLKKQFNYDEKKNITDLELRVLMAKITLYHMYSDSVYWLGYGSGDAQDYLDYYLYSYNLGPNWYQGFNVHNQYLHLLLNYGVLTLGLFLWYLVILFKYAFMSKDYLHIAVLSAFCFIFFFEVFLIRNKGIILFYFINLLFLTNNSYFENRYTRYKGNTQ